MKNVNWKTALPLLAASILTGCASVHGPTAWSVRADPEVEIVYIDYPEDIPCPESSFFSSEQPNCNPLRRYREELAVRDTIAVLITDNDRQSPFYRPGDAYTYGPFEVPASGDIKIPYLGQINVIGATLAQLSSAITDEVQGVSSSADATVLRTNRLDLQAGVIGEVRKPGNFPFNRNDFDAMDLLSAAGGGADHPDNYVYKLKRDGQCYCYNFHSISNHPFLIEDGDVISVEKDPGYCYYTMGQFVKPKRLGLRGPNTSVADAISESGGFLDGKADPKGIFVFRDAAYCGEWGSDGKCCQPGTKYTAYVLDVTRADFPILIQNFRLSERDVVYASEAPLNQASKVAKAVAPIVGLGTTAAFLAR
ncbi:MAG: SLBB domain-containing protein [Verrucomicrobiales bacterium]|nr:SLBB domain-containing protein [Verrucomicrobiales bacterium]